MRGLATGTHLDARPTRALPKGRVDGEAGVAPGQACVFYESPDPGARVLGGGWIDRAEHAAEAEAALLRLIGREPAAAVV